MVPFNTDQPTPDDLSILDIANANAKLMLYSISNGDTNAYAQCEGAFMDSPSFQLIFLL